MEFPMETEDFGGTQAFLMSLRESQLNDPNLLNEFYDKVIESYDYGENYLILPFMMFPVKRPMDWKWKMLPMKSMTIFYAPSAR